MGRTHGPPGCSQAAPPSVFVSSQAYRRPPRPREWLGRRQGPENPMIAHDFDREYHLFGQLLAGARNGSQRTQTASDSPRPSHTVLPAQGLTARLPSTAPDSLELHGMQKVRGSPVRIIGSGRWDRKAL